MTIPTPFQIAYDAWMKFTHTLGRIVSFLLLSLVWIMGVSLYGIILALVRLMWERGQIPPATYWVDVSRHDSNVRYPF